MRPRSLWLLFVGAVAMVLLAMGGVSFALLRLEYERIVGEQAAVREELVRLALWRLDSAATATITREIGEAGRRGGDPLPGGVRARFSVEPAGEPELLAIADTGDRAAIVDLVRVHALELGQVADELEGDGMLAIDQLRDKVEKSSTVELSQQERNSWEYGKRAQSMKSNMISSLSANPVQQQAVELDRVAPARGGEALTVDLMRPLWWGAQLVLARAVTTADGRRVEGSVLDWTALRDTLLAEIADLLPDASLAPSAAGAVEGERQLATLPVRLDPGSIVFAEVPTWRPMRVAVAGAWAFLLVAIAAVALLLRASIGLSERRAAFVSAVTHELRTPLTTFRMYTEMLEGGMVEDKRAQYVSTLRREAERLGALVENVLSYARIEADRHARSRERVAVGDLLARVADRLGARCDAAGIELEIDLDDATAGAEVEVDIAAVEQILFNLVDNAAKYGVGDDARVTVRAQADARSVSIHVRDQGPGIPVTERRSIFEPFAKGAAHRAGTKPGVGLGLALCRRLAREMGGSLELVASERGADFRLGLVRV